MQLHSTETALLDVHNDILFNMDNGNKVTTIILLDVSSDVPCVSISLNITRIVY